MNSSRLEKILKMEENVIKDIRNLFKLKKENEATKDRVIKDIRNLFEHEEEDYYQPVRARNFWRNSYIKYKVMVIEIKPYQSKNIFNRT